ncbi:MAG: sodium/solute symporter [Dethiobacter sp.]|jgi:sodium/pantothenate symporter|nr:sodium/solute symporter [Dethiobacter sp.]
MDTINKGYLIGMLLYFVIVLTVGYLAARATRSENDFALGGRSIPPLFLAFSFIMTFTSSSAFVGEPGLAYIFGWPWFWFAIFCMPAVIIPATLITKRLRAYTGSLESLTIPAFLRKRYDSSSVGILATIALFIFYVAAMIAQLKAVTVIFGTMFNLSATLSVIIFTLVVTIYVTAGGFKAVVWTDVIQGSVMVLISIAVGFVAIRSVGGFSGLNSGLAAQGASLVTLTESTFVTPLAVLLMPVWLIFLTAANPYLVMRHMALPDTKKKTLVSYFIYLLILQGVILFTYLGGLSAKVLLPELSNPDYAIPQLIDTLMPSFFGALFFAGIIAAIMSTMDSMLILLSTSITEDIYVPYFRPDLSDKGRLFSQRVGIVVIAVLVAILGLIKLPNLLSLMVFFSVSGAGAAMLGPLCLGLYWDRGTKQGALVSMVLGPLSYAYLQYGMGVNLFIAGVTGGVIALVTMIAVSLATSAPSAEIINRMRAEL